jgi:tetratricopeptide (TPR) repeat protein
MGENHMGKISMHTAAKSILILTDFSSLHWLNGLQKVAKQAGFYQQFVLGLRKDVYREQFSSALAETLAGIAHHAYIARQMDTVEQVSQVLMNLPVSRLYKNVGKYYRAKCLREEGKVAEARRLLEEVAEIAPTRYRARAVQFLGSIAHTTGKYKDALPYYVEASRIAISDGWCDPHTTVTAQQNIAILKSLDGDHRGALAALTKLFPLVQAIGKEEPYKYHHYLNSLAVELGEVGQIREARNVCRILLASPYINAYPEWRETEQDLALRGYKSRSSVLLTQQIPGNLLYLPEREPSDTPIQQGRARVLSIKKWKKKMGKENGEQNLDEMSDRDLFMEIMHQTSQGTITRKKLLKFLDAIQKINNEPDED